MGTSTAIQQEPCTEQQPFAVVSTSGEALWPGSNAPFCLKREPTHEPEELGSGDGDASDRGSDDAGDYDVAGADGRGGDGNFEDVRGMADDAFPLAEAARPYNPPNSGDTHRRKKGPKEGGQRINWDRPVNKKAHARTSYTDCLIRAVEEAGMRMEDVEGTKQIVTLLLPLVRQRISQAGGDGNCLSYKCLLNKLSRIQKKLEQAEAAMARTPSGGAKRQCSCSEDPPSAGPGRPEQRRRSTEGFTGPTGGPLDLLGPATPPAAAATAGAVNAATGVSAGDGAAAAALAAVGAPVAGASGLTGTTRKDRRESSPLFPVNTQHGTPRDVGPCGALVPHGGGKELRAPPAAAANKPSGGQPEHALAIAGARTLSAPPGELYETSGIDAAGHMLLSCGMRDDVLRGSAAAVALLDPDYLGSLAGVKDRAEAAAKASCEAYESARANTEAATLQVEERRTQLMAVLQGVMEFASQLQLELTKGAAASKDLTSTKSSRQAWEAAEVVLAAAEAERASAGAEAQAAKQRAEQDRAASTVAAAKERDVVDSAGRLVARLGGGESVSQLPDLVRWAVDFMRALSPDQQLEAALKTAAEGYPLSEHALRLLERLNRLQEEAFRGSRLAFRLSTQVTQFVLRVQTADRCAPRGQTAAE